MRLLTPSPSTVEPLDVALAARRIFGDATRFIVDARHDQLVLVRDVRVADPRQHVRDGIGHVDENFRMRPVPRPRCSPRRLRHAGQLARVRQLAEADPAQQELAGTRRAAGRTGGTACSRARRTSAASAACSINASSPSISSVLSRLALAPAAGGSRRTGTPAPCSSARPSSSFLAVVTIVMSIPRTLQHLVVVDLREDQLLGHPDRVVAVPVERRRGSGRGSRGSAGAPA